MSDLARTKQPGPTLNQRFFTLRRFCFLVAAIIIALLPLIFPSSYWRTNLIVCAINVLLAIGLDFVLGYTGQLNIGQSAFYGIGAYASTLLIIKLAVPFWVAFVLGVLISGMGGALLSLFAVRLRGHYLAIASLGFAVITYQILLNWISLTQGPLGIYAIAPPPPIALPWLPRIVFTNLTNLFYLIAGFALVVYFILDQLVRSPIGATLTAIREDDLSAASLGIDAFFITESFSMLAMVIVGGMGTLIGPVFGAILLTVLPEVLRGIGDLRLIVYGAAVTLVVLFMPGGLVQGARVIARRALRITTKFEARP